MPQVPQGYRLIAFDSIDSTNEEARRRPDLVDRSVIWAKSQTAGRGRRGRAWMSSPGNLFLSIVVRPDCPVAVAAQLSFVTALAVSDVVQDCGPSGPVSLKWPNDVLIGGSKACGILLEATTSIEGTGAVIIGIGLNLASHPEDMPYPATDLATAGAGSIDPDDALGLLITAFEQRYSVWLADGFEPIRSAWLERAQGLGEEIGVHLDGETLTGRFHDLDSTGALVLRTAGGGEHLVTAGDVFFPSLDSV